MHSILGVRTSTVSPLRSPLLQLCVRPIIYFETGNLPQSWWHTADKRVWARVLHTSWQSIVRTASARFSGDAISGA